MDYLNIKNVKSRELRGGILFTDCHCLRRNGLQHDCQRAGCQGMPKCTELPYAQCPPARAACVRHCANPYSTHLCAVCPPDIRVNERQDKNVLQHINGKASTVLTSKSLKIQYLTKNRSMLQMLIQLKYFLQVQFD